MVTGGDLTTAERKHGQPFQFLCRALMIAAFNALPRSLDTTEGFFSRWLVLRFVGYYPPGKADDGLLAQLATRTELEGLLGAAINSLRTVMEHKRFDLPASVQAREAERDEIETRGEERR
jgi:putative DNA primase/helicase